MTTATTPTTDDLRAAQERYFDAVAEVARLRAERNTLLVRMIDAGIPQARIARDLGVSKGRINHIIKPIRNPEDR